MPHEPSAAPQAAALPTTALLADRILNPLRRLLRLAGLVILAVMIATPMAQVIMRQFFGIPLIGADELSRFMLISVVMLAIPYTVSSGASVRMEEMQQMLPDPVQRVCRVVIALLGLAAFSFAAWSVLIATLSNLNNATPTLGIPYYIFFSATAVGFFCAALEFGLLAWKAVMGLPMYVTFAAEHPTEELTL
ncbi:TRAP transporter small permease [Salipiger marinus]|uniref:TRAP transporter small permease protein n=1 Tax=Salipiger marinus TaxID=555512 RepID=A0A1G8QV64_9RHOB|nr:TRAP transporter small permease [Salipiger marinus]SDJ08578.1 TRAP-type C4-dicarboxylate transport system, small permease component [Salipiger marinus]